MKFGYVITYVENVQASLDFFCNAFGFTIRFLHESGNYGELESGETLIAFASDSLGDMNFPGGHVSAHTSPKPLGMELALVTDDVAAVHAHALSLGASELASPTKKPWGQTVSYVRCPDGILVELCTPINS